MYPWETDSAEKKWQILKDRGYVSDRCTPDGKALLIYKRGNPSDWGKLDWYGRVTWKEA